MDDKTIRKIIIDVLDAVGKRTIDQIDRDFCTWEIQEENLKYKIEIYDKHRFFVVFEDENGDFPVKNHSLNGFIHSDCFKRWKGQAEIKEIEKEHSELLKELKPTKTITTIKRGKKL